MVDKLFELVSVDCRFEHCTGKKDLNVCKQQCTNAQHLVGTLIAGGVVVLPVKPRDTIYTISRGKIKEWIVYYVGMNTLGHIMFNFHSKDLQNSRSACEADIGETIFLTEEDAINELKEREGDA